MDQGGETRPPSGGKRDSRQGEASTLGLTDNGREFLIGVLLTAALSTVTSLYVFTALALCLSFAALASYGVFALLGPKDESVEVSPEVLRVLKRDRALVTLKMRSGSARWATLVSATSPKLSGLSLEPQGAEGRGVFAIVATRAGRFDSLAFTASFTDALGMFRKTVSVKPGRFVAEVLPLSLLGQAARPMVSAVTWGETPAGMRGAGQEFYGAEEYTPSVESKDILWKRVAKEPERRIVSRIREVNVPRSIRVALVKSAGGDAASWMDSVSETIGRIGMSALEVGMGIEAVVPTNDGPVMLSAFDRRELAELVIGIWEEPALPETVDEGVASSDMLVVGSEALRKGSVMELTERVPSLVVPEGGPPPRLGMRARLLSEDSDVVNFLSMVIMR